MNNINNEYTIKPIAYLHNDLSTKFGVPRQSGLAKSVRSEIVFEPEYRVSEAFRGLEAFSHIWLIWCFSKVRHAEWTPTVRPPRLGGNTRVGVFASRSPYRPNSLAISCVKIEEIAHDSEKGTYLVVSGADLMNDTPIYDIKPYLSYADSIPDATCGFAPDSGKTLKVVADPDILNKLPEDKRESLFEILARDPRPPYHDDPVRVYGMKYGGFEIKFSVEENVATVVSIEKKQ